LSKPGSPNAVSRTLIRGALKRLARETTVEPRPNQRFFLLTARDQLDGRVIALPPTTEDGLYRRIVRGRISGRIPERITQVALLDRYDADRGALLRVLETMSDEGIVRKDKGHGWIFLPTVNNEVALRNSYDLRRMLGPNGILLNSFRINPAALDRIRAAHTTPSVTIPSHRSPTTASSSKPCSGRTACAG
jgi:DNA-binding GntR family transcriptional regulator